MQLTIHKLFSDFLSTFQILFALQPIFNFDILIPLRKCIPLRMTVLIYGTILFILRNKFLLKVILLETVIFNYLLVHILLKFLIKII